MTQMAGAALLSQITAAPSGQNAPAPDRAAPQDANLSPAPTGAPSGTPVATGAAQAASSGVQVSAASVVNPVPTPGISAVQLAGYTYGPTSVYGSNITEAWSLATGLGTTVALIDDGFDSATTHYYGNFFTALSKNFGTGSASDISEPSGGFHGTTTSGLIGSSGADGLPVGLAPNATIVGCKVTFGDVAFTEFTQALSYAASVAGVINNSWGFDGYFGVGEPGQPAYAGWYAAVQSAVVSGRGGLGDVIVFAAGNDRTDDNTLALSPLSADPREIAVAASDANGSVAYYSTQGPGLLVSAIGDSVAVPYPGATVEYGTGTSYSAPTVSAIASLLLQVDPALGWRDVQEILADSAYAPAPSAAGFVTNGATDWNGGGMHFSNDLGYGVVDANVAVHLAAAWTTSSTNANLVTAAATKSGTFLVGVGATANSTLAFSTNLRVEHVQVTVQDVSLPAEKSELILISPDGTQSVLVDEAGDVAGTDKTGGLDLSGCTITSNAFLGENSAGTWTLEVKNLAGTVTAQVRNWTMTVWGDTVSKVAVPLVYTPEFAALAATNSARTVVTPADADGAASTIDLIALPGTTYVNLNGGAGMIDGVAVTVVAGLRNANASGSTGSVTLYGVTGGGSTLTGGDGTTAVWGGGRDIINGGLGSTTINTGTGSSKITLSAAASGESAAITSAGGDTIWAGAGSAYVQASGAKGDSVYAQGARLTFINGSAASKVLAGTGTVTVSAGVGGGTYYAGTGGGSTLTAGNGAVTFYGAANGDTLTAAGAGSDTLTAGAGTETLNGGSNTGTVTMTGGTGADTMTAGLGHSVFMTGNGNEAITAGGLSSLIDVRAGSGGLETVSGFRASIDGLHLVGYGSSEQASAIATQASDGRGGSLLAFSDGTRVDLMGIAAANQTMFA
jgi:subtilisin-like proprotein convertase family protein